jgi:Domain of unknown function (DUF4158)
VLLKVFQRLGHLPRLQDMPFAIVSHVRSSLRFTSLDVTPRTPYRHDEQIRTHLQVKSWGAAERHAAIVAVHQAAQVMDHPADLINVAIEDLVRQRFELPALARSMLWRPTCVPSCTGVCLQLFSNDCPSSSAKSWTPC